MTCGHINKAFPAQVLARLFLKIGWQARNRRCIPQKGKELPISWATIVDVQRSYFLVCIGSGRVLLGEPKGNLMIPLMFPMPGVILAFLLFPLIVSSLAVSPVVGVQDSV